MNKSEKTVLIPKLRFPEFACNSTVSLENGNAIFGQINNKNHNSDLPILAITQDRGAFPRDMMDYNVSVTDKSLENYKIVEIGDFIISLRSFQGGIEYSLFRGICSPAYIILRKKEDIVEQYYKYYFKTNKFIQDLNRDLEGIRDGKLVSYGQFSAILLPKPCNKEQQKIADCLSSLDDLVAAENKKLETLKAHKKGLMQKLFPAEGKAVPEIRLKGYSDAWKQRKLGEVLVESISNGIMNQLGQNELSIKHINVINLYSPCYIHLDELNYFNGTERDIRRCNVQVGDIFITRSSLKAEGIAHANILLDEGCLVFDDHIMRLKLTKEFEPFFIKEALNHSPIKKQFIAKSKTGTMTTIGQDDITSSTLSFPTKPEQVAISEFLQNTDKLITAQSEKIETLKLHKKGLMQGLFPSAQEVFE